MRGAALYGAAQNLLSPLFPNQVGNAKTEYILDGSLILRETVTGDPSLGSYVLNYYYDSAGKLVEIGYKTSATAAAETFYFVTRNSQGDVVNIYASATSTKVGGYTYDAWGKVMNTTVVSDPNGILQKNPFRYRGYYYDRETSWYYLQSRYYDPAVKRFLNADGQLNVKDGPTGFNLFAYCNNNPVNFEDSFGRDATTIQRGLEWLYQYLLEVLAGTALGITLYELGNNGLLDIPPYKPKPYSGSNPRAQYARNGAIGQASTAELPYKGIPNSHEEQYKDGKLFKERWYGPDGLPQKDRHHTDHGNPKHHPNVPHDHDWGTNEDGEWKPGDAYPSSEGPNATEGLEEGVIEIE